MVGYENFSTIISMNARSLLTRRPWSRYVKSRLPPMASRAVIFSLILFLLVKSHSICYALAMIKAKVKPGKKTKTINMLSVLNNPRYRGKHIVVISGKVYTAKTGTRANRLIDRLEKQYPAETPAITYIPKADTLILWL